MVEPDGKIIIEKPDILCKPANIIFLEYKIWKIVYSCAFCSKDNTIDSSDYKGDYSTLSMSRNSKCPRFILHDSCESCYKINVLEIENAKRFFGVII